MKNEKIVNYHDIGEVLYRKNSRARNLTIRINSHGHTRVTVPAWCTYHRAEQFVATKRDWILKKSISIIRKKEKKLVWAAGESISILNGNIGLVRGTVHTFDIMQRNNDFIIELPIAYEKENNAYQQELINMLGEIGKYVAKVHLPAILQSLAEDNGFKYNKLTIRRMKSRWGSCSSTNNISLNSALVFLPDELIRYVCLHELVHTLHKNHSSIFWESLIGLMPEAISHRKTLRNHPIIA